MWVVCTDRQRKSTHNMRFAKMAGNVVLEIFLHLTKFCAMRQISAFYPPSSQSAIRYLQFLEIHL